MIKWIVSSSVLILFVIVLRFALSRRITPCLRYALWGLVLIRLLVPVSLGVSPVSVMNVVPEAVPMAVVPRPEQVPPLHVLPEDPTPEVPSIDATEGLTVSDSKAGVVSAGVPAVDWGHLATGVWLTGFVVVGLFLLVNNFRFFLRLKEDRLALCVEGCSLPVYVTDLVETPCLFGLFRPAIYVTREARRDETVFRHVLEHEATHYRHGDHVWAVLRGVCLALHWYNPLVWLAASLSLKDAEFACDQGTIGRLGEESRVDYGRSLIAMTARRQVAGALFTSATTMTGSEGHIKERISLIATRQRMVPCTFILVSLAAILAACSTFTGGGGLPSEPTGGVGEIEPGFEIYTIPLDDAPFYGPHRITTEPPVGPSDVVEVFAEAELDGVKMMFYRSRDNDIWGAFERADGSIHRFIRAYNDKDRWGYETGFTVELFQDLFGRDGFVMGCTFGASYHAFSYYFMNEGGDAEVLAACVNSHSVVDLDGDGSPELLYFASMGVRLCPRFYAEIEGRLVEVDVVSYLYNTFLGWGDIWSDGSVSEDGDGPYFALGFRLGDREPEYACKVRYIDGALSVEVPRSAIPPDGVAWLVEREDYGVGRKSDGDRTDILLGRGDVISVLDSLPRNTNTGCRYSLRSFDAIPELSGFVLENLAAHGWGHYRYYAIQGDSALCFAESFGGGGADVVRDLDGDGTPELICNVVYGADGVREVLVYRMKDGVPQVASVKDAVLSIPQGKYLVHPASVTYDASTGLITLEYLIAGEDEFRVETAPLTYDSLRFGDFTP